MATQTHELLKASALDPIRQQLVQDVQDLTDESTTARDEAQTAATLAQQAQAGAATDKNTVATDKATVAADKATTLAAKNEALAATSALLWVNNTTYAINDIRKSPKSGMAYRDTLGGVSTTDPADSLTRWVSLTMEQVTQWPQRMPVFNMDPQNARAISPIFTVDRASTALNFDGKTKVKTLQNLEPFSASMTTQPGWVFPNCSIASAGSYLGQPAFRLLAANNGANQSYKIQQSYACYSEVGRTYVFRRRVKMDNQRYIRIAAVARLDGAIVANAVQVGIDLQTGGTIGALLGSYSLTALTDGWYELILNAVAPSGTNQMTCQIAMTDELGSETGFAGNGTQAIFISAPQMCEDTLTPYIATSDIMGVTHWAYAPVTVPANVARIGHDRTTGECLGLLREPSRTNHVMRSSHTVNSAWNASASSQGITATRVGEIMWGDVPLAVYRLDGTTTAGWFEPFIGASTYSMVGTAAVGEIYTASCYFLPIGPMPAGARPATGVYDIDAAGGWLGGNSSATETPSNVVTRATVTRTLQHANTAKARSAVGFNCNVGTVFDGQLVAIGGWQLEKGECATSLIQTLNNASAVRVQDNIYLDGANFKGIWPIGAHTVVAEAVTTFVAGTAAGYPRLWEVRGGGGQNATRENMFIDTTTGYLNGGHATPNGQNTGFVTLGGAPVVASGAVLRAAYGQDSVDAVGALNGVMASSRDATISLQQSARSQLSLDGTTLRGPSYLRNLSIYDYKLSDAELRAVTALAA